MIIRSLLLSLGGGLILLASCSSQTANAGAQENAEPKTGKEIYTSRCKVCHGDDGKRGLQGASDLSASSLELDDRVTIITYGKGAMAGFNGVMPPAEIKAVAQYLEELRPNE